MESIGLGRQGGGGGGWGGHAQVKEEGQLTPVTILEI